MFAKRLTPILNVLDIQQSFAWFEKLGWTKSWDWGSPATFGGICSGDCEIFLCEGGQGGRGKGSNKMTFGPEGDETADKDEGCGQHTADHPKPTSPARRQGVTAGQADRDHAERPTTHTCLDQGGENRRISQRGGQEQW